MWVKVRQAIDLDAALLTIGKTMQIIYTAEATSTGGREGRSVSSDKHIDLKLTTPKEMGGAGGDGTNPEQLFAAGYSACFIGAMKFVGNATKVTVPADTSIHAEVGIGPNDKGGFGIAVTLNISIPGMDKAAAQTLVDKAHEVCPYSNATRGNVDVKIVLV
ncbi:MAG: osmotically inducible protein OsmC [Bradyrhizobium sp.]